MNKDLLFKRCRCTAYLKKVWDGVCINRLKPSETESGYEEFAIEYGNHDVSEDAPKFSPCEGAHDVEKTYYERRDLEFTGVCVGFKKIKAEGYLGVDVGYNGPSCSEYFFIFKEPKTVIDCAIVYFANNQKRYVPLDAIEIMKEGAA